MIRKTNLGEGGSPGLVVMGGESCSKGHVFESRDIVRIYLLQKL